MDIYYPIYYLCRLHTSICKTIIQIWSNENCEIKKQMSQNFSGGIYTTNTGPQIRAPIKGPFEILQISRKIATEGFKGGLQLSSEYGSLDYDTLAIAWIWRTPNLVPWCCPEQNRNISKLISDDKNFVIFLQFFCYNINKKICINRYLCLQIHK